MERDITARCAAACSPSLPAGTSPSPRARRSRATTSRPSTRRSSVASAPISRRSGRERVESTRLQLNAIRQIVQPSSAGRRRRRGASHDRAGDRAGRAGSTGEGDPAARRTPPALAARGRSLGGAPSRPDRRARLDHRRADADRRLRRPLARPNVQLRTVLDRAAPDARSWRSAAGPPGNG